MRLAWGPFERTPAPRLLRLRSPGVQLKPAAELVSPQSAGAEGAVWELDLAVSLPPTRLRHRARQRSHPVHTPLGVPKVTTRGLQLRHLPYTPPTPTLKRPFQTRGHDRWQAVKSDVCLKHQGAPLANPPGRAGQPSSLRVPLLLCLHPAFRLPSLWAPHSPCAPWATLTHRAPHPQNGVMLLAGQGPEGGQGFLAGLLPLQFAAASGSLPCFPAALARLSLQSLHRGLAPGPAPGFLFSPPSPDRLPHLCSPDLHSPSRRVRKMRPLPCKAPCAV